MKRKLNLFFMVSLVSALILTGCQDESVAPNRNHILSNTSVTPGIAPINEDGDPVDENIIKTTLVKDVWSGHFKTTAHPGKSQYFGLFFTRDNQVLWSDINGTLQGKYSVAGNVLTMNIRIGDQFMLTRFEVLDFDGVIYFDLVEHSGPIDFQKISLSLGNGNVPASAAYFPLHGKNWKCFAEPGLRYSFSNGNAYVFNTTSGDTLDIGTYTEDTEVKQVARVHFKSGTNTILVKSQLGTTFTSLYTSDYDKYYEIGGNRILDIVN